DHQAVALRPLSVSTPTAATTIGTETGCEGSVVAGNLTREEARERARILSVDSYAVELDLTSSDQTFTSTTVVRFGCSEPGASSFVDLVAPTVREVTLNGAALDPAEVFDGERITLPSLQADNELRVVADAAYMRTGEGLHRFVDPVDGNVYLYSQFETADAKRMFACFDQPDIKGVYRITVIAPRDWKVVSNAPVKATSETPEGAIRHEFEPTEKISTYLVALSAGPCAERRDACRAAHKTIPLGIYCPASLSAFMGAARRFTETTQGFDSYHRNFGVTYPFAKYDQLFVPEFNAGAMG